MGQSASCMLLRRPSWSSLDLMSETGTTSTSTKSRGGYRELLGYADFRNLWLATFLSMAGATVALVALPLLVYDITGSAGLMSAVFAAQFMTEALLSPITGVLADTFDRKTLMISSQLLRAAAVAFLPFVYEAWQIAVIGVFMAAGKAVFQPAQMASIPNTVPKSELVTAMSFMQIMGTLMRIIGPAVGAAIIGLSGPRPAFGLQAVLFLLAAIWLTRVELPAPADRDAFASFGAMIKYAVQEFREGLTIVVSTPIVRGVCATEAIWSFVMAALSITFVVFARESLDLGSNADTVYALLFASVSTGAVVGALVATRIEKRRGLPVLLAIGYLGPLFLVPMVFTPPLPIIFVCTIALGFTDAWAVIAIYAYLAQSVPDDARGRVFAIWGGIIAASGLVSFAITGWLTDRFGAPATLSMIGLFVGIGGPLALVLTGAIQDVRANNPKRITNLPTEIGEAVPIQAPETSA